jgi:hypothetical protein
MISWTVVGFDSAWMDNAKAPGAVCAIRRDHHGHLSSSDPPGFHRNPKRKPRAVEAGLLSVGLSILPRCPRRRPGASESGRPHFSFSFCLDSKQ